jgi:glycosyltransferase involved in cell wall biosynthesis
MSLKIGMVTPYNPFERINGGVDAVNYNLSKSFVDLGAEVWMLTMGPVHEETIINKEGVNLLVLPDGGKNDLWRRGYRFLKIGKHAIEKMECDLDIDIFVGESGRSTPLTFAKTQKAKKVLIVHDLDGQEFGDMGDYLRLRKFNSLLKVLLKYPLLKLWRFVYLTKADALIFVSDIVYNDYKCHYPFISGRKSYYIIPNGFPPKAALHNCYKEIDFIFVGRIDRRKCVDLIIKASV